MHLVRGAGWLSAPPATTKGVGVNIGDFKSFTDMDGDWTALLFFSSSSHVQLLLAQETDAECTSSFIYCTLVTTVHECTMPPPTRA